jgi:hypothetical protein
MKQRLVICLALLLAAACPAAEKPVDTLTLKSGEVLKGKIVSEEDADPVTIQYEAAKGILDERSVPAAEVASVQRASAAQLEFQELAGILPARDLMTLADYDALLNGKLEPFLKKHAADRLARDAKTIADTLREERARVERGDIKLGGEWIEAAAYQKEKFWIDGSIALARMAEAAAARNWSDALQQFEQIEKTYPGTSIHAQGAAGALKVLATYQAVLQEANRNLPALEERRKQGLANLVGEERARAEAAWQRERDTQRARIEEATKAGSKWPGVDPMVADDLKKTLDAIDKEIKRIGELDTAAFEANEKLLREIDAALADGRIEGAQELIQKAGPETQRLPFFQSLRERVTAEAQRLRTEAMEAERARREASRAAEAREREEKAEQRRKEEQEALETGTNRLGEAARDVVEGDDSKNSGGGISPMIMIIGGLLVALLLLVVVLPKLRKDKDDGE